MMNMSILSLMKRLLTACFCIFVWSHAATATVGEGQVKLGTWGLNDKLLNEYNYHVKVRFKTLDLKYRIFSLLGEPGEVFVPRYELKEISVFDIKNKAHLYTISTAPVSQENFISGGEKTFLVSQDVMNSAIMTSLHFRLRLCTMFDNVEFQRRNPGVLFRGGEWGFDVASSPSWSRFVNVSSTGHEFDNWLSPKDARKAYLDLMSGNARNCSSKAFDATFDIAPLVARITSVYPDAFKFTSAADKQMLSLIGQYETAFQRGDDDLGRRAKLTARAFGMLKAELSESTKRLWRKVRDRAWQERFENKLADVAASSQNLGDDVTSEEFPEAEAEKLRDFNNYYSDKTLAEVGLSKAFVGKLDRLQAVGDRWLRLVPFRANGRYGYRRPSDGKIIITPTFTSAGAFSGGFAIVRGDTGWLVLNRTGDVVIGPSREKIARKKNKFLIETMLEEGCEFDKFLLVSFTEVYRHGRRRLVKSERSKERRRRVTCVQEKELAAKAVQGKQLAAKAKADQRMRLQQERTARAERLKREKANSERLSADVVSWIKRKMQTPNLKCRRPSTPRYHSPKGASRFQKRLNAYVQCKAEKLERLEAYCGGWLKEESRKSSSFREISARKMTKSYDTHCVAKFDGGVASINSAQKSWKRYLKRYNAKQRANRRDAITLRSYSGDITLYSSGSRSSTSYSRSAGTKWKQPTAGPARLEKQCFRGLGSDNICPAKKGSSSSGSKNSGGEDR